MIAIEVSGAMQSRKFVESWRIVRLVVDYARDELRKLGYREFRKTDESREFRSWIAESKNGDCVWITASSSTPEGVLL